MPNQIDNQQPKLTPAMGLVIGLPVVVVLLILFVIMPAVRDDEDSDTTATNSDMSTLTNADIESFPPADARFGFLTIVDPDEMLQVRKTGAEWVRPHPGYFIWGSMQRSAGAALDFQLTDTEVQYAQSAGVDTLVTLWPYATWDQQEYDDPSDCKVVSEEFTREFGWYRCAPYDYTAYTDWVTAVVERYDGDGTDDMPGLTQPITYWEVMNEPDLAPPEDMPGLEFFKGTPADYAKLLKETSTAIRTADPNARVVIAGAAGGNDRFLDFYRELFTDSAVISAFDIANVHCISNDDYDSFNVEPYAAMLAEFGIDKPIWVTEAEAFVSDDIDTIADQLKVSTENAFDAGATKIFYTSMDLGHQPGGDTDKDKDAVKTGDTRQTSIDLYQEMFESL